MKPLVISLVQSDISWEDKQGNLAQFDRLISGLPPKTHIALLPELFATGFSMETSLAEAMDGATVRWMKELSRRTGKIIGGSVMVAENGAFFNRFVWMLPNGIHYSYDKRHLFSYAQEDQYFQRGENRLIVQVNGWKICLQVCYDLRFPVWARQTKDRYDILVNVANWPKQRSYAWDTLLRARAIENQSFVVGVNRVGEDQQGNQYIGRSVAIDPLGRVVASAENKEKTITHTFHIEEVENVRNRFPFLDDADDFMIV